MTELVIEVTPGWGKDIVAKVYYKGEEIDSHVHSDEMWLLNDWGFYRGKDKFNHNKRLRKAVGESLTLIYQGKNELYKRVII